MKWVYLAAMAVLLWVPRGAAQGCAEKDLNGVYGVQLSGQTTISGSSAPAALLARLVLDGEGGLEGYSSVNFNGLLLGNPVTGGYQVSSDCTLTVNLRDDSGGWQHFSGAFKDGQAELQQTDPDTGVRGPLRKAPDSCTAADFRHSYTYTLSGTATQLVTGGAPEGVSDEGRITTTSAGDLVFTGKSTRGTGTFEVHSDCMVTFALEPNEGSPMEFRGILLTGGQQILAIQTDPGESVVVRLHTR